MFPGSVVAGSYLPSRVKKELDWPVPVQKGATKMPAKRVQEWLHIHGFSLAIDSDFGPATEQRVKDFQSAKGIPAMGIVDARTHETLVAPLVRAIAPIAAGNNNLGQLIVKYGLQHVKEHPVEVGGMNRGPWVRAYMDHDGADWLWCAGFACFPLEQAAATLGVTPPIRSSASCDIIKANATAKGLFHKGANTTPANIKPGSFFLIRRTNTDWFHMGIVKEANAGTMRTIEGNSDSGGSSNGTEAIERVRDYTKKDFVIW